MTAMHRGQRDGRLVGQAPDQHRQRENEAHRHQQPQHWPDCVVEPAHQGWGRGQGQGRGRGLGQGQGQGQGQGKVVRRYCIATRLIRAASDGRALVVMVRRDRKHGTPLGPHPLSAGRGRRLCAIKAGRRNFERAETTLRIGSQRHHVAVDGVLSGAFQTSACRNNLSHEAGEGHGPQPSVALLRSKCDPSSDALTP